MKIITTKLTLAEAALIGHDIPVALFASSNPGAIGLYVEKLLTNLGYTINTGAGPDIPFMNVEVKTRISEAVSAHTIGSMLVTDIIQTPYRDSSIYKKIQLQFRVSCSKTFSKITHARVYNFTYDHIQSIIEESYEAARSLLAIDYVKYLQQPNIPLRAYVRGKDSNNKLCIGYFENTNKLSTHSFDFRLKDSDMTMLENMSKSAKSERSCFEFE